MITEYYPRCSECKHPWVLRLVMIFDRGVKQVYPDFMWARDCKHKKAEPEIVQHKVPTKPKRPTKNRSKRSERK